MQKRKLPPMDLLPAFEAAARHLSFTKAAGELFLTQSAISRQIQALEESLGVPLFQRRHRALLLTDAGQIFQRHVSEMLRQLTEATQEVRGDHAVRLLNVSTMVSFASLWLVPRLPRFATAHPGVDVRLSANNDIVDLTRERIDVAIRYCLPHAAPPNAIKLFGEVVMPMCSPTLVRDTGKPLNSPADLKHHILLHDEDASGRTPWLDWGNWLETQGLRGLQPAGEVRFSHYDQMIQAAIGGHGVAIGRMPLLAGAMKRGQLIAPFDPKMLKAAPNSARVFYIVCEPRSASRPEVKAFVEWLSAETEVDEDLPRGRKRA
ncbi:MAG TPA: transcriptional regulator GcvA [Nevskiaceae bacterium]|nr:transcriptional regulator GcvA [Nevskiaceae bacterium]